MHWVGGDDDHWSLTLAKLGGMPLRLHLFFVLFAVLTLFYAWLVEVDSERELPVLWLGVLQLAVLAASVLVHELGHWFAAKLWGGRWRSFVIAPFGGLGSYEPPVWPLREMMVHLAGPVVHGVIVLLGSALLALAGHWRWAVLHVLEPAFLIDGPPWIVLVRLIVWTNWILLLLNVLPGFPFDGIRALRAWLLHHYPWMGEREVSRWTTNLARVTAGLMVLLAIVSWPQTTPSGAWLALVLLSVLSFFSVSAGGPSALPRSQADQESLAPAPSGSTLGMVVSHLETDSPAVSTQEAHSQRGVGAWDAETLAASSTDTVRLAEAAKRERDELVDELLARIARDGIDSLTPAELEVLRRVGRR